MGLLSNIIIGDECSVRPHTDGKKNGAMNRKGYMMRKKIWILIVLVLVTACSAGKASVPDGKPAVKNTYTRITQKEAAELMTRDDGHIIVDVRREDEYASGHIPGAVLIPNESITTEKPEALPDPDQIILVYCRSGNRSAQAAQKLAAMGYTRVYDFGGIMTWDGPVE